MYMLIIFATLTSVGLTAAPQVCISGAAAGLSLCARVIIPSLFPFFVCTKLLVSTGAAQRLGRLMSAVMRPLFNVPGSAGFAFIMGIMSGYPVGAQCGADLYRQGLCTKAEAQRIVCFCNNSGPMFIVGVVGVGMLRSYTAGVSLYIIHLLSAVTVGLLFRGYKKNDGISVAEFKTTPRPRVGVGEALSAAVSGAVELILYVCGFIVFFNVLTALIEHAGFVRLIQGVLARVGMLPGVSSAMTTGFLEVSSGAARISALVPGGAAQVLLSAALAWSGVSVILQVSGIISKVGLSTRVFAAAKLTQAVVAAFYALVAARLPFGTVRTFAPQTAVNVWAMSIPVTAAALALPCIFTALCFVWRLIIRNSILISSIKKRSWH